LISFLVFCGIVAGITHYRCVKGKKEKYDLKLSLRMLQTTGGQMITPMPSSNPFFEEYNDLFLHITDVLDFGVMKYVGDDCPLLVKQEYCHSRFHNEGKKEKLDRNASLKRFDVFRMIFDLLALRLGRDVGAATCLAVEVGAIDAFYGISAMGTVKDQETDLVLFHYMEEAEHSALTVQSLKKKCPLYLRIVMFPLMMALYPLIFLLGPLLTIAFTRPSLFLDVTSLMKYVTTQLPGVCLGWWALMKYYISPDAVESYSSYRRSYDHFVERAAKRNFQYVIESEEVYPCLLMS